jgi:hypothetical protein
MATAITGVAGSADASTEGEVSTSRYNRGMLEAVARLDSTTVEGAAVRLDKEAAGLEAVKQLQASTQDINGYFMNDAAEMVVNVTSAEAAAQASALGLVPRSPRRGEKELKDLATSVTNRLHADSSVTLDGIALDVAQERIIVQLTASPGSDDTVRELQQTDGVTVRISDGPSPEPNVIQIAGNPFFYRDSGSDPVWGPCTQGFSGVRPDGQRVILTAGHCIEHDRYAYTASTPLNTSTYLGQRIGGAYQTGAPLGSPTRDVGLIGLSAGVGYYTSVNARYPTNPSYVPMASVAAPFNEQTACKIGVTTGFTCGRIKYPWGPVRWNSGGGVYTYVEGLWDATMCASPGDSSGPVISGNYAVGLLSASIPDDPCPYNNGPLTTGTFITPVNFVLSSYPGTATSF